jgi:hypothetical protein
MWARCVFTFVLGALVAAAFVGCGSDDEEKQPPGPTTAEACSALCDKQVAANCGIPPQTCTQLCSFAGSSPQCESRARAYIDCQDSLAMVCDTMSCVSQATAVLTCLVPDAAIG